MMGDSKELKEWGLELSLEPEQMETSILRRPYIY